MDTTKSHFIERANEIGVLYVRERNRKDDLTGWGALEFVLENGEVFVVSAEQFGQGAGEDGLWVDMNKVDSAKVDEIRQNKPRLVQGEVDDTISAWLKHQAERVAHAE